MKKNLFENKRKFVYSEIFSNHGPYFEVRTDATVKQMNTRYAYSFISMRAYSFVA